MNSDKNNWTVYLVMVQRLLKIAFGEKNELYQQGLIYTELCLRWNLLKANAPWSGGAMF